MPWCAANGDGSIVIVVAGRPEEQETGRPCARSLLCKVVAAASLAPSSRQDDVTDSTIVHEFARAAATVFARQGERAAVAWPDVAALLVARAYGPAIIVTRPRVPAILLAGARGGAVLAAGARQFPLLPLFLAHLSPFFALRLGLLFALGLGLFLLRLGLLLALGLGLFLLRLGLLLALGLGLLLLRLGLLFALGLGAFLSRLGLFLGDASPLRLLGTPF